MRAREREFAVRSDGHKKLPSSTDPFVLHTQLYVAAFCANLAWLKGGKKGRLDGFVARSLLPFLPLSEKKEKNGQELD